MLQVREKEIFETLKNIRKFKFVVIGGYAVNAYALPRFSVDCDIIIREINELDKIKNVLLKLGYVKENIDKNSYYNNCERYEKNLENNFKVSIDILIKDILDRQTGVVFSADWVFDNSEIRILKGKTITEELKLRIINIDALFVMKMISCRSTDIRDIFMLSPNLKNKDWIKKEISDRYDFDNRLSKIKEKISSKQFKDGLQGIYGYIDDVVFEKHKKALLGFEKN